MNQQGLIAEVSEDTLRDFESKRYEQNMASINLNPAILKDEISYNDWPLDYDIVKDILQQPENLKKIYVYGDNERFLVTRSEVYIRQNKELIERLTKYLDNQ